MCACRRDITIDLIKYRWLGFRLMTGKLDWMLLRNFKVNAPPLLGCFILMRFAAEPQTRHDIKCACETILVVCCLYDLQCTCAVSSDVLNVWAHMI